VSVRYLDTGYGDDSSQTLDTVLPYSEEGLGEVITQPYRALKCFLHKPPLPLAPDAANPSLLDTPPLVEPGDELPYETKFEIDTRHAFRDTTVNQVSYYFREY
jgi:hypothetical protein